MFRSVHVPILYTTFLLACAPGANPASAKQRSQFSVIGQQRRRIVQFRQFERCLNENNLAVYMSNMSIVQIGNGMTALNARINFLRPVARITKLTIQVHKCPSHWERDKCEFFMTFPVSRDFCIPLRGYNPLWSPIVDSFRPPIRCPIKQGTYLMENVTYDPRAFDGLISEIDHNYWIITARLSQSSLRTDILCTVIGAQIAVVKTKNV